MSEFTSASDLPEWARHNQKLLADYLQTLPNGYEHFDMEQWVADPLSKIAFIEDCGTAACSIGHTLDVPELKDFAERKGLIQGGCFAHVSFEDFDHEIYGLSGDGWDPVFKWLFGPEWVDIDNTPQGAAKRIYAYLGGIWDREIGQLIMNSDPHRRLLITEKIKGDWIYEDFKQKYQKIIANF